METDKTAIRVSLQMIILAVLLLFMFGCAYNPYQQPHFDWTGAPSLVPIEERKAPDVGKMCLGPVA